MKPKIGQPLVIIGMHRSGTTLLTKILEEYGIFMGDLKEQNSEDITFLKLNERILRKAGSSWFDVRFDRIKQKEHLLVAMIKKHLSRHSFWHAYLGDSGRSILEDYTWGWKDPRTTVLLPLWKQAFPGMKIIHIYRNPVDVASSLQTRERKFSRSGKLKWYFNVVKNYLRTGLYVPRAKSLEDLESGYRLWHEYVDCGLNYGEEGLHIKYEDFLDAPAVILGQICDYLKIPFDEEKASRITSKMNGDRKYAFVSHTDLTDFYSTIKDDKLVKRLGYHHIPVKNT